ncbi:MAG: hypothetical protein ACE5EE_11310 [Fidelibacterota bacterium]
MSSLSASNRFYQIIASTAKQYRVEVEMDQMKLVPDGKGGNAFHISLDSGRGNYEMVMLAGYIAVGYAMQSGMKLSQIMVTVYVPVSGGYQITTTCQPEELSQFMSGKIDSAEFVRQITYI